MMFVEEVSYWGYYEVQVDVLQAETDADCI